MVAIDGTLIQTGVTIAFTARGIDVSGSPTIDDMLDALAKIRDEYAVKTREAQDQVEFHAAQGNNREVTYWSSEVNQQMAASLACGRMLQIAEAFAAKM